MTLPGADVAASKPAVDLGGGDDRGVAGEGPDTAVLIAYGGRSHLSELIRGVGLFLFLPPW